MRRDSGFVKKFVCEYVYGRRLEKNLNEHINSYYLFVMRVSIHFYYSLCIF